MPDSLKSNLFAKLEYRAICWAKDDPIANVQIGRELDQRCKQAEYVEWGGVGHFPNFEDPDFVAKQIAISTGLGS